ncbi:ORF6N domain-containing protein [Halarcobacter bivalviorum]|uniref:DNA-binding protein n=1 Tax=Halarcobacter bivalviorum TaxID=663364 RepID=A0AAX2AEL5_9BACT|nr:ORF6N domain-containing protein [Halarcobacter bivalviorum]AXH12076.1 ORF6N domain-containing protein [Halarcobacter bivalviorum]RXK11186.1 DNA-binding protein [Halarcobacter bivalviorum]
MENLPTNFIENKIYEIRGLKVMLDSDLASLYEVETKRINEAVKNNPEKFPKDFYFELTKEEFEVLRSKFSTTKFSKTRTLPKVFTEQGVYMLATVLKSKVATDVTINILRTFTKLREFAITYKDIVIELKNLREDLKLNKNQTTQNTKHIKTAFELLSQILEDTKSTEEKVMGFKVERK